jgi:predicted dehydrogenase
MTLRIGIVGAGFMGSTHATSWAQTPATIVGIHALHPPKPRHLAESIGAEAYDSLDKLIADCDVLDICTPTHTHHEIVLKAATAGKHIVCEKPLARTLDQAHAMLKACQTAGVKLLVAQVVRFFPEYALAKAAVERGDIGKVAVVRLTRCSYQPKLARDNWYLDFEKSGGMMLDLMIHDFDYARWVAGDVESVFAKSVAFQKKDAPGDYALVILRHKNGAISNIEGGWAYPPPMFRTSLEIAGDAGLIEHPADSSVPLGVHLRQTGDGGSADVGLPMSPLSESPYTTQIRHFYDVLTADKPARVLPEDGFASLQIALAAIESAQTGKRVKLTGGF